MSRVASTIGRLTPVVLLNAVAVCGMSLACLPCVVRAGDAEHAVADDPASNVIVLDSEGDRAVKVGGADDFVLCVKADGTASIRTRSGQATDVADAAGGDERSAPFSPR